MNPVVRAAQGRRWSVLHRACPGLLFVALLAFAPATSGNTAPWSETLHSRIDPLARRFPGELSLYVRDVKTGDDYGYRADEATYLSSTIKLVVAVELLRQIDAGTLALDRGVVFGRESVRDGVGPLRRVAPGRRFTVEQLLELMLVHSDNAAADLLIGLVGASRLDAMLAERGLQFGPLLSLYEERLRIYGNLDARGAHLTPGQIRELGRHDSLNSRAEALTRMFDARPPLTGSQLAGAFDAFYAAGFNSASMRQMGLLLEQIARCEGLSAASCDRLRRLMLSCLTGTKRIKAGLPAGAAWAHKTGTQHRRACDVGVLYLAPDRPIVVAACASGFRHVGEAEAAFERIGRAVWGVFGVAAVGTASSGAGAPAAGPKALGER